MVRFRCIDSILSARTTARLSFNTAVFPLPSAMQPYQMYSPTPPPVPPAPANTQSELEAILAGINSIGTSPGPLPPTPQQLQQYQQQPTLIDSVPHSSSISVSSSSPASAHPPVHPHPHQHSPPVHLPVVHYTHTQPSATTTSASLLSPTTSFSPTSTPYSNSTHPPPPVDLASLNTVDLRRELEALKRKSTTSAAATALPTSTPPPPLPPAPSTAMLHYNDEVARLKRELAELKRKEDEMIVMQQETQRLVEEERRAAEVRQRELEHYHRTVADSNTPTPLSAAAFAELESIQTANAQREAKLKVYAAEEVRLRALKAMAEEQFRQQRAVDVCFVVDCTSSMSIWIAAVKDKVMDIVSAVKRENDCGEVRVAFVGYRDYFDTERFILVDFTTDLTTFRADIAHVTAVGGGDIPEDMAGGLWQASQLSWRARTRSLIVIADAPCHGRDYHHFDEDARNTTVAASEVHDVATVLVALRTMGVDMSFAKITKGTDVMLERFKAVYDKREEGKQLRVLVLGNSVEVFLPQIVASITDSISRTRAVGGMHGVRGR